MVPHTGWLGKRVISAPTLSELLQMVHHTGWLAKKCNFCTQFVIGAPYGPPYILTGEKSAISAPTHHTCWLAKVAISAPTLSLVLQMGLHRCCLEKISAPTLSVVLEMVYHTGRLGTSAISARTLSVVLQMVLYTDRLGKRAISVLLWQWKTSIGLEWIRSTPSTRHLMKVWKIFEKNFSFYFILLRFAKVQPWSQKYVWQWCFKMVHHTGRPGPGAGLLAAHSHCGGAPLRPWLVLANHRRLSQTLYEDDSDSNKFEEVLWLLLG